MTWVFALCGYVLEVYLDNFISHNASSCSKNYSDFVLNALSTCKGSHSEDLIIGMVEWFPCYPFQFSTSVLKHLNAFKSSLD